MIWIIKFLQKRPSDLQIRVLRIIFWLIIAWSVYYNFIYLNKSLDLNFYWYDLSAYEIYFKYGIWAIWLVPIIIWAFDICLFRKKYIRWIQSILWILLFYIAIWIFPDSAKIDIDFLFIILSIIVLIAWISGKCITKKCMRYKEKITKIRV